jgi:hypothetical protein
MSFFANHLDLLGPGAIAWWRLPLCVPRWQRRVVAGLTYGIVGFVCAVLLLLAARYSDRFLLIVFFILPVSIVVGLASAVTGAAVPTPAQLRRPGRRQIADGIKGAIPAGLGVGFAAGLYLAVVDLLMSGTRPSGARLLAHIIGKLSVGTFYGVMTGLLAAVMFGFIASFSRQQRYVVTPLSAFRDDRTAGLMCGLVGCGVASLIVLVPTFYFIVGPLIPVALGASVFWFGLRRCAILPYGMAVTLLVRRGVLPPRPLQFLEDAYRRGVLRQAGMVYEFRHARLVERLLPRVREDSRRP